jgi:RNA polymerase sigma-70 factor (ECF subfamily)
VIASTRTGRGKEQPVHRELVDRARRGDEEAFDALAREVGDRCMAIACRILRDAHLAEDAVQAALVVAWRELRTLRDPDRFEPWLHRILTNQCYAEARRRTRWSANIRLLPVDGPREAAGILTVNDRDQLERAFRRLTLEQRAVLVYHHYVGLSLPEVADRLGIPRGTAKSRLHHATAALRASIDADSRTPPTSQERFA